MSREIAPRPRRPRDPLGKAALFSETRRAGTVVVECGRCGGAARVSYVDFVRANLPVGLWLPIPGLRFNRRMTCPSCGRWTWVRARWLD